MNRCISSNGKSGFPVTILTRVMQQLFVCFLFCFYLIVPLLFTCMFFVVFFVCSAYAQCSVLNHRVSSDSSIVCGGGGAKLRTAGALYHSDQGMGVIDLEGGWRGGP